MAGTQKSVAIPEPTTDTDALWRTTQALKEAVEVLQGDRGNRSAALTVDVTTSVDDLQDQLNDVTSSSGVSSFNSRTGAVAPQQSDYDSFFLTQAEGDASYEDDLGNPSTDGDHLVSTIAGARTWETPSAGPTHTGEVTGGTNLTLDITAITNRSDVVAAPADDVAVHDDSDGTLKKVNLSSITDAGYF